MVAPVVNFSNIKYNRPSFSTSIIRHNLTSADKVANPTQNTAKGSKSVLYYRIDAEKGFLTLLKTA